MEHIGEGEVVPQAVTLVDRQQQGHHIWRRQREMKHAPTRLWEMNNSMSPLQSCPLFYRRLFDARATVRFLMVLKECEDLATFDDRLDDETAKEGRRRLLFV